MKNEANYNNNYMRIPEDSIQAIVYNVPNQVARQDQSIIID